MPRAVRLLIDVYAVWLAFLAALAGSGFLADAVGAWGVLLWLAVVILAVVGYFRRRPGQRWAKSIEDERNRGVFLGGCQWRTVRWSWPLIRLTVSEHGIAVKPSWRLATLPLLNLISPPREVSWAEIKGVQKVKTLGSSRSMVAFDLPTGTLFFGVSGMSDDIVQAVSDLVPEKVVPGYRRRFTL